MARSWRLLRDGEAPGPWNMGVDEALLETARREDTATLRLYAWRGPWLSLGYRQRLEPERAADCAAAGVGLVRRASGGGAVLHGGDLGWTLAAPEARLPEGRAASYALAARALRDALARLGVRTRAPGAAGADAGRSARDFDCFASAAADALCADGRKLAGSAQRRVRGAVLQHGSLRVAPDPARARAAAGLERATATSLREQGCEAPLEALVAALLAGFSEALDAQLEPGALARRELVAAGRRAAGDPLAGAVPLPAESQGARPPTR